MAESSRMKSQPWLTSNAMITVVILVIVTASSLAKPRHEPGSVPNKLHTRGLTARADSVPVYTTCNTPGSFSLTFDDGPSEFSSNLDATLDNSNSKASFFINGNNFGCIYDHAGPLLDRFNNGHLIASHTWSHVHLNQGTYEQIAYQLELIENAMIKILGVKPLYFRPPYGEYNEVVLQVLRDRGYRGLILWSQDSGDSLGAPPSSSEIIESYRSYPAQTNVLNHETKSFTVNEVIPNVIPILKDRGFNLQTVPACLNLGSNPSDWYVSVQQPGSRDETWTCNGTPSPGNFE
ncbi:hypothetical protein PGT21_003963 [Puccinia graminis f. sp. tritici]|uniref:NodB homology domain-containing protein n=1 Tax=Puccinia graminis f. sp. tritici TaxID=56615 RepID=A0A5B0N9G3_PUCGR|nr:hypothetical protein PGT21_003963 [Puccinia graminis f. sp. tritici]